MGHKEGKMSMTIEKEFKNFMQQVYSKVPVNSSQYKTSRVVFYSGAFMLTHSQDAEQNVDELMKTVSELRDVLKLASEFAKKGIQPEDTLADYVEGKA